MFERFTEEARQVVVTAQQEARNLRHGSIDTEHLLLGVLADRRSGASRVLKAFGVTVKRARGLVVQIDGRGETPVEGCVPFTPEAKKALSLALREAVSAKLRVITPELVLRGLLRVDEGVAVRVLLDLNVDPRELSDALTPLLPVPNPPGPPTPRAFTPRPVLIRQDETVSRVLETCVERTIDGERSEYGLADLLEAIADDPEAFAVAESLGIDLTSLRDPGWRDVPGSSAA